MRYLLALVITLVCIGSAYAAEAKPKVEVVNLTVHAADVPRPALKHRLRYTPLEQTSGNAALLYLKACLMLEQAKWKDEDWTKVDEWLTTPVEKLPVKEVADKLESASSILHLVDLGSRRMECDWGHPLREEQNPFAIVLPELQSQRKIAKLVALRARLNIAKGDTAAAIAGLREGYTLACHVGNDQFLVNCLVGIAVSGVMDAQLRTLLELPETPNLYWSLTDLPDPLISLRKALDFEAIAAYLVFPELQKALGASMSEGEAATALHNVLKQSVLLTSSNEDTAGPAAFAAVSLLQVPKSRQRVIARGLPAQQVDKMPPAQVILADMALGFADYRDELFKWFALPYPQAAKGIADAEQHLKKAIADAKPVRTADLVLPGILLPAIEAVRTTETRIERDMALLRIVEALRYHAAKHDKRLPARLDEVKDLPIPANPFTGAPFPYRIEKDTAVLAIETPNQPAKEYRITVKK